MTNVDLARVEFAFVSVNHFFFVPITIGLAFLTALLQTAWYRSKRDEYLRLTRFFGWDKLPRRIHLATIWAVSLGSALSAAFILAANSWMQHPVGYTMVDGKPQLNDIWALFTNPVFVWGYAKVVFASLVTGTVVMLAVSAWQLRHGRERDIFTRSARLALIVLVPAILFTMLVGDELGVVEGKYQPM